MKNRFLSLAFLLFCFTILSVGLGTQTRVFGQQKEFQTVPFCELMSQPAKYAGKLVRIRAAIVTGLDWQLLVDRQCDQGADPAFPDCSENAKCEKARQQMRSNINFRGDIWRVEVIVVGELKVSPSSSSARATAPPVFVIKEIERSFKIPHEVPLPYN